MKRRYNYLVAYTYKTVSGKMGSGRTVFWRKRKLLTGTQMRELELHFMEKGLKIGGSVEAADNIAITSITLL